jgi:hypothetical protein
MSAISGHVDIYTLMAELLSKAEAGGSYNSPDQSIYYMLASLISKLLTLSTDVAGIGNESTAFDAVRQDIIDVQRDISKIQQWVQEHPGAKAPDATFIAEVKQFEKDMLHYLQDVGKYGSNSQYNKDGMNEAISSFNMIWNTNIQWSNDHWTNQTTNVGQDILNGNTSDLADALLYAAQNTTSTSGTLYDWTTKGVGSDYSLSDVDTDFNTFISNFDTELNTDGTYLQQDDQVGQNGLNAFNSMINQIIANFKSS